MDTPGLALLLLAGLPPAGAAPPVIEVAVLEDGIQAEIALAVLKPACARPGLTLRPRVLPLRRGLQDASAGSIDNDLMRAPAVLKDHPGLLPVGVPVLQLRHAAYQRGSHCARGTTLAEMSQRKTAYLRGVRLVERTLRESAPAR